MFAEHLYRLWAIEGVLVEHFKIARGAIGTSEEVPGRSPGGTFHTSLRRSTPVRGYLLREYGSR